MRKNRVWLYCRVAHDGPDSAGLLETQKRRLEGYAKEHELEIVGYSRDMENGLTVDRPGLLKLHKAVKENQVDVLLTQNISRLGRNVDMVIRYWHFLQAHGVRVFTVTDGEIYLDMGSLLSEIFKEHG